MTGPLRHFHPTARLRLAALLTSLFLTAGILLLALSYALVRNNLTLDPSQLVPEPAIGTLPPATPRASTPAVQGFVGALSAGGASGLMLGSGVVPAPDPAYAFGLPSTFGPASSPGRAPTPGLALGLTPNTQGEPKRARGLDGPLLFRAGPGGPSSTTIATGGSRVGLTTKADVARLQRQLAERTLRHLLVEYLLVLGGLGLLAAAGGWLLAGRVLRPIKRMTRTARAVSQENLSERIAHDGPEDELKELADTFDEMLARLQGAFERQRAFIANASHELRTPLAIIRTEADVALGAHDPDPRELLAAMRAVRAATARSDRLIGGLLTLARVERDHQPTSAVELSDLAAEALRQAGPDLEGLALRVTAELEPVVVRGDVRLLETLLRNLIENAVRYNHVGGWLAVRTRLARDEGGTCTLCVRNGGNPIPPERLSRLTQPFQRLAREQPAEGTGLGLSIVQAIVTAHQGTLELRANAVGGMCVQIELPAARRRHGGVSPRARPHDQTRRLARALRT